MTQCSFTVSRPSDRLAHAGMSRLRGGESRSVTLMARTSLMSSQAAVHSIDELKNFRGCPGRYGEDASQRWVLWKRRSGERSDGSMRNDRPPGKNRSSGGGSRSRWRRSEVFRRNLQKKADYTPAMSEQKGGKAGKAEASLHDAEKRLGKHKSASGGKRWIMPAQHP